MSVAKTLQGEDGRSNRSIHKAASQQANYIPAMFFNNLVFCEQCEVLGSGHQFCQNILNIF
jgi:hypothetical protein